MNDLSIGFNCTKMLLVKEGRLAGKEHFYTMGSHQQWVNLGQIWYPDWQIEINLNVTANFVVGIKYKLP